MFKNLISKIWHSISCRIVNLANSFKISSIKRRYKKNGPIIAEARIGENRLCVITGDSMGVQILSTGKYEELDSGFIEKNSKPDWICFDVGANVGYWSVLLASLCPSGTVHAFKPASLPYSLLETNINLNNLSNVISNRMALGESSVEKKFFVSQDSGFSSFHDTGRMGVRSVINVGTTTLDNYVSENGIKKINFLKIDVEGAEKAVIDGAKNTLSEIKPGLILIELINLNLNVYGTSVEEMTKLIKSFGYSAFVLDHITKKLRPFDKRDYDVIHNVYFRV